MHDTTDDTDDYDNFVDDSAMEEPKRDEPWRPYRQNRNLVPFVQGHNRWIATRRKAAEAAAKAAAKAAVEAEEAANKANAENAGGKKNPLANLKSFGAPDKPPPNKGLPAELNSEGKMYRNMRSKARKFTDIALKTLVDACTTSPNHMARIRAACELLDRAYGKPHHAVTENKQAPQLTQIKVSFGEQASPKTINGSAIEHDANETIIEYARTDDD